MQRKKGISLIVLVITIIVMIVLAGAIIITLNNSGIIEKANEAVDKTNEAQVQQIAQLGWAEAYAEYGDNVDKLTKGVEDALTANGINPDDYEITVTKTGVTLTKAEKVELVETEVPAEWKTNVAKIINGVPIPKGFVVSSVKGETTKEAGLVIYEGTGAVTASNYYDSLTTRNQYVWVPVPDYSQFVRRTFGQNVELLAGLGSDLSGAGEASNEYWEVVLDENNMPLSVNTGIDAYEEGVEGITYYTDEQIAEIQAMYASVKKYGGFYIARYEGSKDENNKATSVMNARQTNSATYGLRGEVTETLIYGVQWDTTVQWIFDSGLTPTGYALTDAVLFDDLNEGATYGIFQCTFVKACGEYDIGNCDDDHYCMSGSNVITEYQKITSDKSQGIEWYLSTGALKTQKHNNIYDLFGNYRELTNEKIGGLSNSGYGWGFGVRNAVRNGLYRGYVWYTNDNNGYQDVSVEQVVEWDKAYRSALYINN